MKNSAQLSQLVTCFERWRINRANRNIPTPNELRRKAVSLKTNYTSSKITRALRISGTQLKLWSQEFEHLDDEVEFVSLPNPPEHTVVLEFNLPQGEKLRLTGLITASFVATMIKEMRA